MQDPIGNTYTIDTEHVGRGMAAMQWFKMYAEFATDPKVQSMTEVMQRRLAMLFCFQCNGDLDKLDEEELALALRITPKELQKTKEVFARKGFIEDGWNPKNWDKRQSSADKTAAQRMRRYRERLRNQGGNGHRNVTDDVTRNALRELEEEREEPPLPPLEGGVTVTDVTENNSDTFTLGDGVVPETGGDSGTVPIRPKKPEPFVLPDWIPADDWDDFLEMRKRIRKPATDKAKRLIVKELARLKSISQRNDPAAVLQQSIVGSWQNVYALKSPDQSDQLRAPQPITFHRKGDHLR